LINRDEAIQKLKAYWEVTDFTFLARFDVPISQQEIDEPNAFGFFKEIYWNKKQLFFPSEADSQKRNSASCYAKKKGLKHNSYYIITAELSPDDKRKKNPYALTLINASEATQEEIDQHRSNFERKETVYLAYVNFVARDKSHAFVKVVEGLNSKSIKNANGTKGEIMYDFPESIEKEQIILVKKRKNKKDVVIFVSDTFYGTVCNGTTFLDLNTFPGSLGLNISDLKGGFNLEEIKESNSRVQCAVKIFDSTNLGFKIEKIETEDELILTDVNEFLQESLKEIIESETITTEVRNRINFLEKIDSDLPLKFESIFNEDLKVVQENPDTTTHLKLLEKWTQIYPDVVRFSVIKDLDHLNLYLKWWKQDQLPVEFFEDDLFNCFIHFVTSEGIDYEAYLKDLHPNRFAALKNNFLELFDKTFVVDSEQVYSIMETLLNEFPYQDEIKKNAFNILRSSITEEVQFKLWREKKLEDFPLNVAVSEFSTLDEEQQEQVISQLSDDELTPLFDKIKISESEYVNDRLENLNQKFIFEQLDFIVFDIESDTKTVFEIAWSKGANVFYFKGEDVVDGINQFRQEISKNPIIIGHNILDFDLPILNEIVGLDYDPNFVWDTLSIEKVLSPELKTYALNTKHTAKEDVSHTLRLFKNQFFRLLRKIESNAQFVNGILPDEVLSRIVTLGKDFQFRISTDNLNKDKLDFYRPQPKTNTLIEELNRQLSLSEIDEKVILGVESLAADLMTYGKVTFSGRFADKNEFQLLNIKIIEESQTLSRAQKGQLSSYFFYCQEQELIPYWGNVSPSIRNEIESAMDVWTLFSETEHQQYVQNYPQFILSSELENLTGNIPETHFFIIQPDLISISQKQLLKQVEVEQLKALFQDNFFWMKFSGGQSVVSISKEEVQKLILENIDDFDSYWIEKYQFGKYRIYANKNWEQIISKISFKQITKIVLDPEQFKSDQVISVKFKPNKTGEYNVTRFNPESVYRSRYWVIQKKIIDQLVKNGVSILLIQRPEEIEILTKYFESDGYYIPNADIGLGRRLELLHRHSNRDKLIIAHLSDVDSILKWNHSFPVNLIVDSFNLIETYYCARGTSFFNDYIQDATFNKGQDLNVISDDEDTENMDVSKSVNADNFLKDYVFLLKILRPRITNLRNLLFLNNPGNKLLLLDPRIDDYSELSKQWNITKQYVQGWNKKEDFEQEVLKSEGFIKSPKPLEVPFNEEETIEIIRNVFIGQHQWKPEQLPYLKEILKTKEDWLINLPTGVGKSVLFQGPALLKSAFTNRLTVVITPLKALMEDHVNKLWELGFYGCVDYLNADRSSDTELIYRSIAGGEMSLLFVTPERFRSKGFLNSIDSRIQSDGGLEYFVFDEAHCVSQWGHDFRPDYFNCAKQVWRTKTVSNYPTPLLLFSATVSEKIYQDFNAIFS
jgi:hypothetical protein